MKKEIDKKELFEIFGSSAISKVKKYTYIYKRTKKKRIKKKQLKLIRKFVYPEVERTLDILLPIQIKRQFENFAPIRYASFE